MTERTSQLRSFLVGGASAFAAFAMAVTIAGAPSGYAVAEQAAGEVVEGLETPVESLSADSAEVSDDGASVTMGEDAVSTDVDSLADNSLLAAPSASTLSSITADAADGSSAEPPAEQATEPLAGQATEPSAESSVETSIEPSTESSVESPAGPSVESTSEEASSTDSSGEADSGVPAIGNVTTAPSRVTGGDTLRVTVPVLGADASEMTLFMADIVNVDTGDELYCSGEAGVDGGALWLDIAIDEWFEPGNWVVVCLSVLSDGDFFDYYDPNLAMPGSFIGDVAVDLSGTIFEVYGNVVDSAPPIVEEMAPNGPTTVTAGDVISFTVKVSDDLSGVSCGYTYLRNADTGEVELLDSKVDEPVLSGTFEFSFPVEEWMSPGVWFVDSIDFRDEARNEATIDDPEMLAPLTFEVTETSADFTPPYFDGVASIEPQQAQAGDVVAVTLCVNDEGSGVADGFGGLVLRNAETGEILEITDPVMSAGDGTVTFAIPVDEGVADGRWVAINLDLMDNKGNIVLYYDPAYYPDLSGEPPLCAIDLSAIAFDVVPAGADPGEPDPDDPGEPDDPTGPEDPGEPEDPDAPGQPEDPAEPEGPGTPSAGEDGTDPSAPAGEKPGASASIPQTGDEGAWSAVAAAFGGLGALAAGAGVALARGQRGRATR